MGGWEWAEVVEAPELEVAAASAAEEAAALLALLLLLLSEPVGESCSCEEVVRPG